MRQLIDVGAARPLLDIASYARKGSGRRDRLSAEEIDLIRRTVSRTPEVMVKVLTRGGQNLKAVRAHLAYLTREGELDFETDDGNPISGAGADNDLLNDWNLDLEELRPDLNLRACRNRNPPKLAHKILFSMPPGTPPGKVLTAVMNFAREEFALRHRYALVLHTDEPHPHVHVVVKAMGEQGTRLNIRKATLRGWRREFARQLVALGVPANATERAVRGEVRPPKRDGIYRAEKRGRSESTRARAEEVARNFRAGIFRAEAGKSRLIETRRQVARGWSAISGILMVEGQPELATQVKRFGARLRLPQSHNELVLQDLLGRTLDPRDNNEMPTTHSEIYSDRRHDR